MTNNRRDPKDVKLTYPDLDPNSPEDLRKPLVRPASVLRGYGEAMKVAFSGSLKEQVGDLYKPRRTVEASTFFWPTVQASASSKNQNERSVKDADWSPKASKISFPCRGSKFYSLLGVLV